MDKKLGSQKSTLYIFLKAHPSKKHISVKLEEYKLFGNQINRLAEVMDQVIKRALGRQNLQTDLISLEAEEEVTEIILFMADIMTEVVGNF